MWIFSLWIRILYNDQIQLFKTSTYFDFKVLKINGWQKASLQILTCCVVESLEISGERKKPKSWAVNCVCVCASKGLNPPRGEWVWEHVADHDTFGWLITVSAFSTFTVRLNNKHHMLWFAATSPPCLCLEAVSEWVRRIQESTDFINSA